MQRINILRSFTAIFWLGFLMALSFVETPLKFTAPGITMAEGVAIGRVIFNALNKFEWVFFAVLIITCFYNRPNLFTTVLISTLGVILLLQTAWALPILDVNAVKFINGDIPASNSAAHIFYVAMEVLKIPLLLFIGIKSIHNNPSHLATVKVG